MTSSRDEQPLLGSDDEEFVAGLAANYTPPPMTPAERAAFDASLRARVERRRRPMLIPVVGVSAAVAAAALVLTHSLAPTSLQGGQASGAVIASSWEDELFLSSDLSASEDREESEMLPEDYLAIASTLLGG